MTEALARKGNGSMAARPVDHDVCLERHKAIDEKCTTLFHNQDEFYDSLASITKAFTSFSASQTEINGQITKQLKKLSDEVEMLKSASGQKWDKAVGIVMQFLILGALAIVVAKIGL